MLDTISIELNIDKHLKKDDFERISAIKQVEQHKSNSLPKSQTVISVEWPKEIEAIGSYLPQVEYMDYPNPIGGGGHGRCYRYRITFSVPKLIYGNNISEVTETQFNDVVRLLHSKLVFLALPTNITEKDIKEAIVRRIDYGKNIVLSQSSSIRLIGDTLMKAEHRHRSKYSQVQYRNGDLYREHIKNRATILYDKIAEYCNTKTKPITDLDKKIFELNKNKKSQIVRLEVQIKTTQQLKLELERLGLDKEATRFEDVFSDDIAQRILKKYWSNIVKGITPNTQTLSPQHLAESFTNIASHNNHCGPQKAFAKLGFNMLSTECGLGKVKELYCDYFSPASWSRDKLKLINDYSGHSTHEDIQKITQTIESMKPISVEEVAYGK